MYEITNMYVNLQTMYVNLGQYAQLLWQIRVNVTTFS